MTTQDNGFQDRLYGLTLVLIEKLDEQLKENREHNVLVELDNYRHWLAENHPELSRQFEQRTSNNWEESAKQLAMLEAVAHGILWALDAYRPL
jgi:hypothetical protein